MKKLFLLFRYLSYRIKAKTRYSVHSQFVYDFINNILRDKTEYDDYAILWNHRNSLAASRDPLETVDFGVKAGKQIYSTHIIPVGKIVRMRSHNESRLKLLYRIAKYSKPKYVLELGTGMGISTSYIKKGAPDSSMITMEGCANLAARANEAFEELDIENIDIAVGNFDAILDNTLKKFERLDLVFFDGNHRKDPTLRYFEKCVLLSNENSIFVFDDIHYSKDMENAWEEIKKDSRVSVTIDLFWFGLVFFRGGIEKQDFILRY